MDHALATTRALTRVRRWLGEAEVPRASWQEDMFRDIGAFLTQHMLDPTPANYDLAYQYRSAENAPLVAAVDDEIARCGMIGGDAADRIVTDIAAPGKGEALGDVASAIAAQAAGVSSIVRQSGLDVTDFRVELERRRGGDAASMIDLAQAMVAKTRAAEEQLRQAQKELVGLRATLVEAQRVADVDPLTELPNRRAFKRDLEAALDRCASGGRRLSLAFIDIDHFKRINDGHGHDAGDRVLRYVAALLSKHFADIGIVGRFGGEEFVVMLPDIGLRDAIDAVDGARMALSERTLHSAVDGASIGTVTFSAGVTGLRDGDGTAELLRRADEALYRAKDAGRDRVVIG